MLDKLVSDLVGPSVSGAASCFATGDEETSAAAGEVDTDDVFHLAAPDGSRCLAVRARGALDESGWRALAEGAWPIFCHPGAGP